MASPVPQLYVVAFAMRPLSYNPDAKQFSWAVVTAWLHAVSADAAVERAKAAILVLDWQPCIPECQVNLASNWKKPIPQQLRETIGLQLDETVFEIEGIPLGPDFPEPENIFRDPLTTKQITTKQITTNTNSQ